MEPVDRIQEGSYLDEFGMVWLFGFGMPLGIQAIQNPNNFWPFEIRTFCFRTIMFGRVIYTRRRCRARVLSVYLTHIMSHQQQLFFDTEREYTLCPSTCVLLIEILATINLY